VAKVKYTTELIVSNLKDKFGDAYDYTNVEYNGDKPIHIICNKHKLDIKNHYYNLIKKDILCSKCKAEYNGKCNVINKLNDKFGEDYYGYDKLDYVNNTTKIKLICKKHGEFELIPADIPRHNGCEKCRLESNRLKEYDKWLHDVKIIHGNKYDYSLVDYQGSQNKVKIICSIHGEFETTPEGHKTKSGGCKDCRYLYTKESNSIGFDEIVKRSNVIHDSLYEYINNGAKSLSDIIEIICKKHGKFTQLVDNHLGGAGCPKCYKKTQSLLYNAILEKYKGEVHYDTRKIISPFELDLYIPEFNLAIEYNGLMDHSVGYDKHARFNNTDRFNEIKYKHRIKTDKCLAKGIQLFHIFENEWKTKKEIILSMIFTKLNIIDRKIFARKCIIKYLSHSEANEFHNSNHLMGNKTSNINIGLLHKDEIVSVMSFNKHEKYDYELTRFSSKLSNIVIGGASKLYKRFINDYDPQSVVSYVNRRFGTGKVYSNVGFYKVKSNYEPFALFFKPNTIKLYTQTMFRKFLIRKYHQENRYDITSYDDNINWYQNMMNNGYRIIFDSGNYTYIWENSIAKNKS